MGAGFLKEKLTANGKKKRPTQRAQRPKHGEHREEIRQEQERGTEEVFGGSARGREPGRFRSFAELAFVDPR